MRKLTCMRNLTTRSARCAVRRRAQLGREELSSQLVFLMPLIFIHFIRAALVQAILPIAIARVLVGVLRVAHAPQGPGPDCPRRFSRTQCIFFTRSLSVYAYLTLFRRTNLIIISSNAA